MFETGACSIINKLSFLVRPVRPVENLFEDANWTATVIRALIHMRTMAENAASAKSWLSTTKSRSSSLNPTRAVYSVKEDEQILEYILSGNRHCEIKGRSLWTTMEKKQVIRERTWHSLKNRFHKNIWPNIHKYSFVTSADREKIKSVLSSKKQTYHSSESNEDSRTVYKKFTKEADEDILSFIVSRKKYDNLGGNELWKGMAHQKITRHSWQAMRNRFRRHILKNLDSYNISDRAKRELKFSSSNILSSDDSDQSTSTSQKKKGFFKRKKSAKAGSCLDNVDEDEDRISQSLEVKKNSPIMTDLETDASIDEDDIIGSSHQQSEVHRANEQNLILQYSDEHDESDEAPTRVRRKRLRKLRNRVKPFLSDSKCKVGVATTSGLKRQKTLRIQEWLAIESSETSGDDAESAEHEDAPEGAEHEDAAEGAEHEDAPEGAEHEDDPESAEHEDDPESAEHEDGAEGAEHEDGAVGAEHKDGAVGAEHEDAPEGAERKDDPESAEHEDVAILNENPTLSRTPAYDENSMEPAIESENVCKLPSLENSSNSGFDMTAFDDGSLTHDGPTTEANENVQMNVVTVPDVIFSPFSENMDYDSLLNGAGSDSGTSVYDSSSTDIFPMNQNGDAVFEQDLSVDMPSDAGNRLDLVDDDASNARFNTDICHSTEDLATRTLELQYVIKALDDIVANPECDVNYGIIFSNIARIMLCTPEELLGLCKLH